MLPPCGPGGTECGRSSPATATPMIPRNGASGKETFGSWPGASGSSPRVPVSSTAAKALNTSPSSGYSPGSAPFPCRLEITPYGTRGRVSRTVTASRSPGRAPATWTGRETTCGPSTPNVRGWVDASVAAIAMASDSTCSTSYAAKKASGSRPWSSRMPSWLTVSKVTSVPGSTRSTGSSAAHGSRPHRTCSGVEGRYVAPRIGPAPVSSGACRPGESESVDELMDGL